MSRPPQVLLATITAGVVIAFQILAKATRDTVFLTTYPADALPWMVSGSAVLAIAAAFILSRLIFELGPKQATISLFLVSAFALGLEWLALAAFPRAAAVVIYLQLSVLTILLISGFWSTLNECFDPYTAKRSMSRIAAGATAGGLLGGLIAERCATWLSPASSLLLIAGGHVVAAGLCTLFRVAPRTSAPAAQKSSGSLVLRDRYLRNLAIVVALATAVAGVLDFLFKAEAAAQLNTQQLMTLFGFFYAVTGIVTFLTQILVGPSALKVLGVVRSTLPLPLVTMAGAGAIVLFPNLGTAIIARGSEAVLRSSLFRSGYELFFSPLSAEVRRKTKPLIDVGADRLGDVASGLVVGVMLLVLSEGQRVAPLSSLAFAISIVVFVLVLRLQKQYIESLESSLTEQGDQGSLSRHESRLFLTAAGLRSLQGIGADLETSGPVDQGRHKPEVPRPLNATNLAEVLGQKRVDPKRVEELKTYAKEEPRVFIDLLCDSQTSFAVRRRIPRFLLNISSAEVDEALLGGLSDGRFEVRFHCGSALFVRRRRGLAASADPELLHALIAKEVKVDRRLWTTRKLLEAEDSDSKQLAAGLLASRIDRSLEHVFHLLAPLHPEEPLRIAFKALHTDDQTLRGTALEYLETILPLEIRQHLWLLLGEERHRSSNKSSDRALESLLKSHASIQLNLKNLR